MKREGTIRHQECDYKSSRPFFKASQRQSNLGGSKAESPLLQRQALRSRHQGTGGGQHILSKAIHSPGGAPSWEPKTVPVQGVHAGVSGDPLLLQAGCHGELVNRGIGLGSGVVRRREAAAGFTAVVTVAVIHGAIGVFKS